MHIKICDICLEKMGIVLEYNKFEYLHILDVNPKQGLIFRGDICDRCKKIEKENSILDSLFIAFKERIEAIRKD